MTITLSLEQSRAADAVGAWLTSRDKPWLTLHGLAGTGKTTLAKHLAELQPGRTVFSAFSGKACDVLRRKGCPAQTIHSLIYLPTSERSEELETLRAELNTDPPPSDARERKILSRIDQLSSPKFAPRPRDRSPLTGASLLVLDECFVGSTMVDTPFGKRKISEMGVGDLVFNAWGVDQVAAFIRKEASELVQIKTERSTFACSRRHPFFTKRGLVRAENLQPGDALVSLPEAMRLLRQEPKTEKSPDEILRHTLQCALVASFPRISRESLHGRAQSKGGRSPQEISKFGDAGGKKTNSPYPTSTAYAKRENSTEVESDSATYKASPENSGWERSWNEFAASPDEGTPWKRLAGGVCYLDQDAASRHASTLQSGPGASRTKDRDRGGRWLTPFEENPKSRPTQGSFSAFSWVESVEILEQGHPELERHRDADGKLYLYDLKIERHSSFSVEGVLVHNCSMVNAEIARDLLSFEVPILVLGDPGQLPPIEGAGYFDSKADFTLTEIHRQAAESPVIQLAMAAREGRPLRSGAHGSSYVTSRTRINESLALGVSQIVCGSNKARTELNIENRKLRGFSGTYPKAGERLICLRNNPKTGVFNGQIFETTGDAYEDPDAPSMIVIPTADYDFRAYKLCFTKPEALKAMPYYKRAAADEFDFAWALTGHRAQGSQWPSVLVWADQFRWQRDLFNRWMYTSISRAEERVVVAL